MNEDSFTYFLWHVIGMKYFIWVFIVLILITLSSDWYGSCVQASVYNKINNSSFTCSDFFWASEQINSNTQTFKIKN